MSETSLGTIRKEFVFLLVSVQELLEHFASFARTKSVAIRESAKESGINPQQNICKNPPHRVNSANWPSRFEKLGVAATHPSVAKVNQA